MTTIHNKENTYYKVQRPVSFLTFSHVLIIRHKLMSGGFPPLPETSISLNTSKNNILSGANVYNNNKYIWGFGVQHFTKHIQTNQEKPKTNQQNNYYNQSANRWIRELLRTRLVVRNWICLFTPQNKDAKTCKGVSSSGLARKCPCYKWISMFFFAVSLILTTRYWLIGINYYLLLSSNTD